LETAGDGAGDKATHRSGFKAHAGDEAGDRSCPGEASWDLLVPAGPWQLHRGKWIQQ